MINLMMVVRVMVSGMVKKGWIFFGIDRVVVM